jgi:hypothetical protein
MVVLLQPQDRNKSPGVQAHSHDKVFGEAYRPDEPVCARLIRRGGRGHCSRMPDQREREPGACRFYP